MVHRVVQTAANLKDLDGARIDSLGGHEMDPIRVYCRLRDTGVHSTQRRSRLNLIWLHASGDLGRNNFSKTPFMTNSILFMSLIRSWSEEGYS